MNGRLGVTLVEVMISLVVLLIVFMGLIQASIVTIDSNVRNELRDEAVRIAADTLTRFRATNFDDLDLAAGVYDPAPGSPITRDFRNLSRQFVFAYTVVDHDVNNKEVIITVRWDWKERTIAGGNPYIHTITTIVRR